MASFMDTYFGPLPREYCMYFYYMAVIFGFLFAFNVAGLAIFAVTSFRRVNSRLMFNAFVILLNLFLAYIVNRLLYTMCVKAI